jgi:hypothetical protein
MTDDDDTMIGSGDDPTTVVPDIAPTQAGPELAWSTETDTDDFSGEDRKRSWRQTIAISAALVATTAAIAGTAWILGGSTWTSQTPTPTARPTPTTAAAPTTVVITAPPTTLTEAAPPPAPPAPPQMTQNERYLALIRLDGSYDNVMQHGGVGHARLLCTRLEDGDTVISDHEQPTVYDTVDVYCPDFDPRGPDVAAANAGRADTPR